MSVGAGVDPEGYRVSAEAGESYSRKKVLEFFRHSSAEEVLIDLVRDCARTGHRGDGIIITSDVGELVNIRTGEEAFMGASPSLNRDPLMILTKDRRSQEQCPKRAGGSTC